jgi:SNF2 family DNA or RNA helicase
LTDTSVAEAHSLTNHCLISIEQAIDRVHRIGQTLSVHVVRLLVNHTIEQKVVALQQKKARIIHGALGDGVVQSTKLTTQEIRKLFDL